MKPPVVVPQEFPREIMARIFKVPLSDLENHPDYDDMLQYLVGYAKMGEYRRWDEFRSKISPPLLERWNDVLVECRRNGFINPRGINGKIVWSQVCSSDHSPPTEDMCVMCIRPCLIREALEEGVFKFKKARDVDFQEPTKCWEVNSGSYQPQKETA